MMIQLVDEMGSSANGSWFERLRACLKAVMIQTDLNSRDLKNMGSLFLTFFFLYFIFTAKLSAGDFFSDIYIRGFPQSHEIVQLEQNFLNFERKVALAKSRIKGSRPFLEELSGKLDPIIKEFNDRGMNRAASVYRELQGIILSLPDYVELEKDLDLLLKDKDQFLTTLKKCYAVSNFSEWQEFDEFRNEMVSPYCNRLIYKWKEKLKSYSELNFWFIEKRLNSQERFNARLMRYAVPIFETTMGVLSQPLVTVQGDLLKDVHFAIGLHSFTFLTVGLLVGDQSEFVNQTPHLVLKRGSEKYRVFAEPDFNAFRDYEVIGKILEGTYKARRPGPLHVKIAKTFLKRKPKYDPRKHQLTIYDRRVFGRRVDYQRTTSQECVDLLKFALTS